MQRRLGLNVGGEDLGVTAKVHEKRVAPPPAFDLDDVEGNIAQQVFQGGADADAMAV